MAQEAHGGNAHTHVVQGLRQLHPLTVLVAHSATRRQADNLRLHRAGLTCGAEVLAVGHHRRRNGAWRRRLDILVDNLAVDALAVACAVGDVDVVILVDVVRRSRAVDRVDVTVRIVRGTVAVDRLVDGAVADVRIEIAVRGVGRAGVLVDIRHRARVYVLVDVGHRARILVDIGVRADRRAGVHVVVRVRTRADRRAVVVIRAGRRAVIVVGVRRSAGGRVVIVVRAVRGTGRRRVVDIFCRGH